MPSYLLVTANVIVSEAPLLMYSGKASVEVFAMVGLVINLIVSVVSSDFATVAESGSVSSLQKIVYVKSSSEVGLGVRS